MSYLSLYFIVCACVYFFFICAVPCIHKSLFSCITVRKIIMKFCWCQWKMFFCFLSVRSQRAKLLKVTTPPAAFVERIFFGAPFECGTKQEKDRWGRSEWAGIGKKEHFLLATGRRRSASQLHVSGLHQLYQGRLTQCLKYNVEYSMPEKAGFWWNFK